MFATLQNLDPAQVDIVGDALEQDGRALCLLDPSGVFLLLTACAGHEVDFACVRKRRFGNGFKPQPLTPLQHSVVEAWAAINIPAVCKAWARRHPRSRQEASGVFGKEKNGAARSPSG